MQSIVGANLYCVAEIARKYMCYEDARSKNDDRLSVPKHIHMYWYKNKIKMKHSNILNY